MHRIEETLDRGICIGCGACSAATGGAIPVTLGPTRLYRADISGASPDDLRAASRVCPFSDESPNEDDLGAPHGDDKMVKSPFLGQYSRTFAGRVSDDDYVMGSSSGGLTSWLLDKLIGEGHVDAVISVGRSGQSERSLFDYSVLAQAEVANNRKSQYYAATMAEALAQIEGSSRRFALVGVPCFIRAARALCRERSDLDERLVFMVGLVCGHYKTQALADSFAWQLGVSPTHIAEVDFRVKSPDAGANDYDFGVLDRATNEWRSAPVRQLVGGNWGHSAFQPEACNFCDDVVGETADVSFGDAWLPQFTSDSRGTNIVVSRNRLVDRIFDDGRAAGEVTLFEASPDDAVASQAGGFRHRREGLSVRLADDLAAGLSVPRKRVSSGASAGVSPRRRKLIQQRRRMAAKSHEAFGAAVRAGSLDIYLQEQRREIARYRRIEHHVLRRFYLRSRRAAAVLLAPVRRSRSVGN